MQNPSVKEFRKSVKIRQSYHEKFDASFLGHSVVALRLGLETADIALRMPGHRLFSTGRRI